MRLKLSSLTLALSALSLVSVIACEQRRDEPAAKPAIPGPPPAPKEQAPASPSTSQPPAPKHEPAQPAPQPQGVTSAPMPQPEVKPLPQTTTPLAEPNEASKPQPEMVPPPVAKPAKQPDGTIVALEKSLPETSALDTVGGQLLMGYLDGRIPGEQVVTQTFDQDDFVVSNLAEMSLAIHRLRDTGAYNPQTQEKVLVLEGAMTQYMNERIQSREQLAKALEYGTAIGVGLVGGLYSEQILSGLHRAFQSRLVQAPVEYIGAVGRKIAEIPSRFGNWRRGGEATGERGPIGRMVDRSADLARKATAYAGTRGGAEEGEQTVFRNIMRVINHPDLSRGYRVSKLSGSEEDVARRLVFQSTGVPGFRVNQHTGTDYLTARQLGADGEYYYYIVRGLGIKTATRNGTEIIIPPETGIRYLRHRLAMFASRTVELVTDTGQRIKTSISSSRAYQAAANNPRIQQAARGTMVGAPLAGLTLLALRPIDFNYLTLEDYVRDLQREGINIDEFIELRDAAADRAAGR